MITHCPMFRECFRNSLIKIAFGKIIYYNKFSVILAVTREQIR